MKNQIVHKLVMKTCQRWTSQQRASSCCQTVECKNSVLIMADTEWLQTCPVPSEWSRGKIFNLRPSLPAQDLFIDWGGQWDISVHTEGDAQPLWDSHPWAPMNLQHEECVKEQCNIQRVMGEENVPEVTFLKLGCCHGPLDWSKEHVRIRLMSKLKLLRRLRVGEQRMTGNPSSFMPPRYSSQMLWLRLHSSVCIGSWT